MRNKASLLLFAQKYWKEHYALEENMTDFFDRAKYHILILDSKHSLICGSSLDAKKKEHSFSIFVSSEENGCKVLKKFNNFSFLNNILFLEDEESALLIQNYSVQNPEDLIFLYDPEKNKIYYDESKIAIYFDLPELVPELFFSAFLKKIKKNQKKFLTKLLLDFDKINFFELEIKNKNDYYTWFNLTSIPLIKNNKSTKYLLHLKDISARKNLEELLLLQAKRDSLTNLLNRTEIEKEINSLIANNIPGILIMIDVDNFKLINDRKGHLYGDYFLKTTAKLISKYFKNSITSRTGGDEFIIYLKHLNKDYILKQINSLKIELKSLFEEDFNELEVDISFGKSFYPKDGSCFSELYHQADKEMYFYKKKTKIKS